MNKDEKIEKKCTCVPRGMCLRCAEMTLKAHNKGYDHALSDITKKLSGKKPTDRSQDKRFDELLSLFNSYVEDKVQKAVDEIMDVKVSAEVLAHDSRIKKEAAEDFVEWLIANPKFRYYTNNLYMLLKEYMAGLVIDIPSEDESVDGREVAQEILNWLENEWAGKTELEFRIRHKFIEQKGTK